MTQSQYTRRAVSSRMWVRNRGAPEGGGDDGVVGTVSHSNDLCVPLKEQCGALLKNGVIADGKSKWNSKTGKRGKILTIIIQVRV